MRFAEILLIATLVSGGIWLLDILLFRSKRLKSVMTSGPYRTEIKEPWWVEYSKTFFPILLIVFLLRSFLAEPFRIPSGSMHPTLWEGDFIVVNKYDYGLRMPITGKTFFNIGSPKRGDVIVFKHIKNGNSIDMIKRVIGLPGDRISYKDKVVYINNEPVKQEFLSEKTDSSPIGSNIPVRLLKEFLNSTEHDIFVHANTLQLSSHYPYQDVTVPENSYFVMGDNRDNSEDSRMWGFVKDEDVQGRAFGIWMSWDSSNNKVRWERLVTKIQ